jgi:hypothetical protein
MRRPPAASTPAAWLAAAAPVSEAGFEVVGPTGVAVAEPPGLEGVVTVPLPAGVEAPPLGAETRVLGTPVPEGVVMGVVVGQGTVTVV